MMRGGGVPDSMNIITRNTMSAQFTPDDGAACPAPFKSQANRRSSLVISRDDAWVPQRCRKGEKLSGLLL